ncbi:hypothetical protein [Patulibacter defluvii]|uniref:hypothetical protein n=1 Tax=Patulibacter defluvii TaxID=3095358 RepID=UPI002A755473|nr:hypothetical protein [Patulibacter sp. DM4]
MLLSSRRRPLLVLGLTAAVAVVPVEAGAAPTSAAPQVAPAIAKKKRKKRPRKGRSKPAKTTATVSGSWTISRSGELRGGVESEKLTVTVKDGTATFPDTTGRSAKGKADVAITYQATYGTDDRSWHAGCDREERTSTATFHERAPIYVYATNRRTVGGVERKLAGGWAVEVAWPSIDEMGLVTTGYFEDWESIAMQNCLRTPIDAPLGHWNVQFAPTLAATGGLDGGGTGVLLTHAQSGGDQREEADGRIRFSRSVAKR